jgi:hypothetical protein
MHNIQAKQQFTAFESKKKEQATTKAKTAASNPSKSRGSLINVLEQSHDNNTGSRSKVLTKCSSKTRRTSQGQGAKHDS